jgi:CRP-like cAMP-binding protein
MQNALRFLTTGDQQLLLEQAETCVYHRNETILEEGTQRPALFIVRNGSARIERAHFGRGVAFGRLGTGDIFGEATFLDATPASVSVIADEDDVAVDVLDGQIVQSLLVSVPGLAPRFYQSLAVMLAQRLRETSALLPPLLIEDVPQVNRFHVPRASALPQEQLPPSLVEAVEAFKTAMMQTELALKDKKLDDAAAQDRVSAACEAITATLREHVQKMTHLEQHIGAYVFRETFSFFMRSANVDRWFTKPRGYAGDFYTIELVYANQATGEGRLGRFIDRWALGIAAAQAVRNRRGLLNEAIRAVAARVGPSQTTRITSLASGPAREVFDLFADTKVEDVHATCIDIDAEALAFASERARELGIQDRITFAQDNVIRLSRGRGKTTLEPQHLIYSIGLIDYLEDEHIVRLLDWIYDQLLPSGTVILGNFDAENPDKAFMDHILEWRLIHRTPDALRGLFARSKFGDTPMEVTYEERHVNLFAICTKRGAPARPSRQSGVMAVMQG